MNNLTPDKNPEDHSTQRWYCIPRLITRIKNGYKQFWSHTLGKWIFTHRRVAEKMVGEPIPAGFEVHHINSNKMDNRAENLEVLPQEEHQALHSAERMVIDEHSAGWAEFPGKVNKADNQITKKEVSSKPSGPVIATVVKTTSNVVPNSTPTYPKKPVVKNVPRVPGLKISSSISVPSRRCPRCGGRGYLWEYSYYMGGICFRCYGTGKYI